MADDREQTNEPTAGAPGAEQGQRELTPAARRALQEAAERRAKQDEMAGKPASATEHGGRAGPDPVRYGDWENGGIVSDF